MRNASEQHTQSLSDDGGRTELAVVNPTFVQELSTVQVLKDNLRYTMPYLPANLMITASALISSKLLAESGPDVLAALSYIYTYYGLAYASTMLFIGVGVSVANALGENDVDRIRAITKKSFVIAGLLSIPTLVFYYQAGNLSRLIGATDEVVSIIQRHMNQFGWGVPLSYLLICMTQTTVPYTTVPSAINMLAGTVVSTALSVLFTKGLNMPIVGPALGPSVTNALALTAFTFYVLKNQKYRNIIFSRAREPHPGTISKILNIGGPTALNALSQTASLVIASVTISAMLDNTALQQQGLTAVPLGFLQTLIALNGDFAAVSISKFVGANQYQRIAKYRNNAHVMGLINGVLGTALIAALSGPYVRYFADAKIATPKFIATTQKLLLLASAGQLASSIGVTSIGALRGIDENWYPTLFNIVLKLVLNIGASFALTRWTNLGVYSPYVADLALSTAIYSPTLFGWCKRKFDRNYLRVIDDEAGVALIGSVSNSASRL